jgi:hypothetical protein
MFLDTDALGGAGQDCHTGDLVQNTAEAAFVSQLAYALVAAGLAPDALAALGPYRQ